MPLLAERFPNLQHFRQLQIGMRSHGLGREPGLQQLPGNLLGLGASPFRKSLGTPLRPSLDTTLGSSLDTTFGKSLSSTLSKSFSSTLGTPLCSSLDKPFGVSL